MAVCKCFKKHWLIFLLSSAIQDVYRLLQFVIKKNYIPKLKWELVFDRMHFDESLIDFLSFDL